MILNANPAFFALVVLPKELVLNRDYYEFLPAAVRLLFRKKLQEAFRGQLVRFDMHTAQGSISAAARGHARRACPAPS